MPPTHQRFKALKERRISLGPWLCKLSEHSELSALSVPGSLDCWLPGSVAAWLPNRSIAPWLPGGLAPRRPETFPRDSPNPRTWLPESGLREAGNGPARGSSGSRLRRPETHGTRATGCLEGGGTPRGTPRRVFLRTPPCYKSFGFRT